MRILILGATGQIGYALTGALARTSHDVRVLVRDATKHRFPDKCRVLEARPFDGQAFRRALQDIDHVIYCVGLPEQYLPDPKVFEGVNLDLLKAFLAEMAQAGPSALSYVSTYEVFQAIDGVVRESHPVAGEEGSSPYFRSMIRAYRWVRDFSVREHIRLVTIHPAAVYGGLNTGDGLTNYIDNLLHKRFWRVPCIFEGRFPVVHADSLAEAIIASLCGEGAYIVSDETTTLKSMARTLRRHADSYVPISAPVSAVRAGAAVLERAAGLTGTRPIMARVQIDFVTRGIEPVSERIVRESGWHPLTLEEGLVKYLETRFSRHFKGSDPLKKRRGD